VEGPRVEQALDALPHRQASAGVLAFHPLGAAQFARQPLAPSQLLELRLPRHRRAAYGRASAGLRRRPRATDTQALYWLVPWALAGKRSARLARAMGLADLHALVPVLAAAGEKSKTAFYVAGAVLAAWAVVVSVVGVTRPGFPGGMPGQRAVIGVSVLLAATTVTTALVTASN